MTALRPPRHRAGITLTEILISILIMGVGMLSLATLFPLGLSRLRDAARMTRSSLLIETASGEINSRDLLYKPSFPASGYVHDPFTEDPAAPGEATAVVTGLDRQPNTTGYANGVSAGTKLAFGPGVPVCYDPLWWFENYRNSGGTVAPTLTAGSEYRFASGIGLLRDDPSGGTPSAHGLQRITNFPMAMDPASLMASPDDPVMQTDGTSQPGRGSPVVPDMSMTGGMQFDYAFTWMFTGQQTDSLNGTIFDGDLVIFHNRPYATDATSGTNRAVGETVVEAIWGYGTVPESATAPYGQNDRKVLLRWPSSQIDPDVRVGGWIADVTYERYSDTEVSRWYPAGLSTYYPAQRCSWYRVAKKTEVTAGNPSGPQGYREMTVTLASPVKARTPIGNGGTALRINACLVNPYVVNVVPRVFYTR